MTTPSSFKHPQDTGLVPGLTLVRFPPAMFRTNQPLPPLLRNPAPTLGQLNPAGAVMIFAWLYEPRGLHDPIFNPF